MENRGRFEHRLGTWGADRGDLRGDRSVGYGAWSIERLSVNYGAWCIERQSMGLCMERGAWSVERKGVQRQSVDGGRGENAERGACQPVRVEKVGRDVRAIIVEL
jgi:hypothetical protein